MTSVDQGFLIKLCIPNMSVFLTEKYLFGKAKRVPVLHTHPCYELIFSEGLDESYFVIVPPSLEHLSVKSENEHTQIQGSFLFSFESEELVGDVSNLIKQCKQPRKIPDDFGGIQIIHTIHRLTGDTSVGAKEQLIAELRLLFVLIARRISSSIIEDPKKTSTLDDGRFCILEDYLNFHFSDPKCGKTELAELLGVCERQLSRIMLEKYNCNFKTLLLRMRMNMAFALLSEGEKTVAEVAEAVGYQSVSAFRRAYRSFFGASVKKVQNRTLGQ